MNPVVNALRLAGQLALLAAEALEAGLKIVDESAQNSSEIAGSGAYLKSGGRTAAGRTQPS